jgi:phage/plasmid-like protein (TIGR03299 family)
MAHYFHSGVFYGEGAWHGLGTTLEASDPRRRNVEGTIQAAGMDTEVIKVPLATSRNGDVPEPARGRLIPDRFAIVRTSDWQYLGCVGEQYRCLQNREMFQWFQPFLDSGACEFETAGSLCDGRVVWVLARLCQDDIVVKDKDTVRPYLLLSSSHDGSMATRVGFAPIRVVCWNTLSYAHQVAESKLLKVKHTENQQKALEAVRDTMDLVHAEFRATAEQYRRLAEAGITEQQLAKYSLDVLGVKEDETISTRTENQLRRIVQLALGGRGAPRELTAWSAYQGLTAWISHERQKNHAKRLESLWFGDSAKMNARAYELALALAS